MSPPRSFVLRLTNNPHISLHPLGETPLGRIMFTTASYMSCALTNSDAGEILQSTSWTQASDEEIASVARLMTTYCGPFQIYEEDGKSFLKTDVEISLDPTWMGKP
ncbi:hypothetical protein SLS57_007002 [Botryosphaeria dothidea]